MSMTRTLAELREAIEKSGVSRYAISQATGIDQTQLHRLVKGTGSLRPENIDLLLKYLGLEMVLRKKPRSN